MKQSFLPFGLVSVALALSCQSAQQRQEPAQAAALHDACSGDAFCAPSGLICHVALGCVQCRTNGECESDTFCSSEGVCIASQACTTQNDCGGDYCVNGTCNECLSDDDCDRSGESCEQGVCRLPAQLNLVAGGGAATTGEPSGTPTEGGATGAGEPTGTTTEGGATATGATTGTPAGTGGSDGTTTPNGGATSSAGGTTSTNPSGGTPAGGTTGVAGTSNSGATGGEPVLPTVPAGAQTYAFSLSALYAECWNGTTTPFATTTAIEEVRVSILPVTSGDVNFDFCIYRASMFTAAGVVDLTWGQDGWMAPEYGSNASVGVAGPWFAFNDEGGSSITGGDGTGFTGRVANGDPLCVSGTAVEVQADDFDTYWGSVVAFQPNAPAGEGLSYVPADYGVDTIRLVISGTDIPTGHLRFGVFTTDGVEYCGSQF